MNINLINKINICIYQLITNNVNSVDYVYLFRAKLILFKKKNTLAAVGFEPTPPRRLVP